jgi:hypothetical protein
LNVWCSAHDGQVTLSTPYAQFTSVSPASAITRWALLVLSVVWPVAALVTLIASGLRKLIRRPAAVPLRRLRNVANAVLVVFAANLAAFLARLTTTMDTTWSNYLPHFVINALVPFATVVYGVLAVRALRRAPTSRWEKTLAIGAGLGLLVATATVLVFNLWR